MTNRIKNILNNYESDNPGTKTNLMRILMSGATSGTGKIVILPVDQGFEHGPDRSFAMNPEAYDPHYHYQLAIDAKLSAFAAPLGMLESGADTFAGQIPTILKINSANSMISKDVSPNQAITGNVKDALRLGCVGIGFTIYPGSNLSHNMIKELSEISYKAKRYGLVVLVWSYPRGEGISKIGESSVDIVSYGAHIAALCGAHIIKVKPPIDSVESLDVKKLYSATDVEYDTLAKRVSIVKRACFNGRRLVVFSGGSIKGDDEFKKEILDIASGGGDGSIIGRNAFQKSRDNGLQILGSVTDIWKNSVKMV